LLPASGIAVLFGLYEQVSVWSFIAPLPEIAWEATSGIWLIVKGFKPSPILREAPQGTFTSVNSRSQRSEETWRRYRNREGQS
jgi:hypothetical protein